jgi:multiple sugar transport system substrate-binding protein
MWYNRGLTESQIPFFVSIVVQLDQNEVLKMAKWMRYSLLVFALAVGVLGLGAVSAQDPSITIWTKFNSDSPQNSQDEWMAALIADYGAETGGTLTNVTRPFDTINVDLNLAILAGGSVPDVSYIDATSLTQFYVNETLMDLTEFVTSADWYDDLSPAALAACTAPDGAILCVPTITQGTLMYYWVDAFPNGFDGSIDALTSATTQYQVTGKSAEQFGFEVFFFPLIASFGGTLADEKGFATWTQPETVEAIEWIRSLHTAGAIPEVSLASGFDYENSFKDASAGSFIAGSWSYVYLNPVTAPDGTVFPADSTSIPSALEAGELGFAAPLHKTGSDPVSFINVNGWAIPYNSGNPEAAMAFINWAMESSRLAEYAVAYGGLPSRDSSLQAETFQTPYWVGVADILNEYGSPPPAFFDYAAGASQFANTVVNLILNPDRDILTALQQAQDEYNAEVAAMM